VNSAPKRNRVRWIAGLGAVGVMAAAGRYYAGIRHPLAGEPLRVGLGDLMPGKLRTVEWMGRTVFLLRRTPEVIATLAQHEGVLADPNSVSSQQPEACRNRHRSLRPELFVAIGQCTHQGCVPALRSGSANALDFLCPCHTSRYDVAGRVFRDGPALTNLVIPEYRFDGDDHVVIGDA
jgi:ubiquinol-cytochrome c reductase iron-sulfur subunit